MYSNFHINQRNFGKHLKRIFAKVLQNVWFVFANYLYDACKYAECDFETVIDTFKSENEFGSSHWDVPGPDGERGFGGKCLPKDTSHFAHVMSKHFSPPNFLNFVLKDNDLTR